MTFNIQMVSSAFFKIMIITIIVGIMMIITSFVFSATAEYKDACNQTAPTEQGRSWRYSMLGHAPLDLKLLLDDIQS